MFITTSADIAALILVCIAVVLVLYSAARHYTNKLISRLRSKKD